MAEAGHFGPHAFVEAVRAKIKMGEMTDFNSTVTIVTAYFRLQKSKHSHTEYNKWMQNSMQSIQVPMVIFTTSELEDEIRRYRKNLPTAYVTYSSIWESPPGSLFRAVHHAQHAIDPEKRIHAPGLYAVWTAKVWFALVVALHDPFRTPYVLWVDAGAFRHRAYKSWPDNDKFAKIINSCGHDSCMLVERVSAGMSNHQLDPINSRPLIGDVIAGGFFGGKRSAMLWWCNEFFDIVHHRAQHGDFFGKEQTIFNQLVAQNFWRVIWMPTYNMHGCGQDVWFAFQDALAPSSTCQVKIQKYGGFINVNETDANVIDFL